MYNWIHFLQLEPFYQVNGTSKGLFSVSCKANSSVMFCGYSNYQLIGEETHRFANPMDPSICQCFDGNGIDILFGNFVKAGFKDEMYCVK